MIVSQQYFRQQNKHSEYSWDQGRRNSRTAGKDAASHQVLLVMLEARSLADHVSSDLRRTHCSASHADIHLIIASFHVVAHGCGAKILFCDMISL
jgi:hypothetical protein